MTNSYVPGNFVTATKEFTVDIAGTATTFPAVLSTAKSFRRRLPPTAIR